MAETTTRWRPIAEAPTDGTAILAYEHSTLMGGGDAHWMDVVQYQDPNKMPDGWYSVGGERGPPSCNPTHWMELPAPPPLDLSTAVEG